MNKIACFVMFIFCLPAIADGQESALLSLDKGKEFFWQAQFDSAGLLLQKVIEKEDATRDEICEAHIFLAFTLSRMDMPEVVVEHHFTQAIKMDLNKQLDEVRVPPDLVARFNIVRANLVGCVYLSCDPAPAEVAVVVDTLLYRKDAPGHFCGLLGEEYHLVVTKPGYSSKIIAFFPTAGDADSLFVQLNPSSQVVEKSKKRVWPWLAIGGGVVATTTVLLLRGDSPQQQEPTFVLPEPPVRPTP
jgi:hypothetical protein